MEYAMQYGEEEWRWREAITKKCDEIERRIGGLAGKRVLDLGAGPGQYSIAFAERGADVTWHDPSRNYLRIAQQKAAEYRIECRWSLGYLEDAVKLSDEPFDLIFNRICWYYCISDSAMARIIVLLLKPGGVAWLDIPTSDWARAHSRHEHWLRKLGFFVYANTGLKLCHFMPERGKVLRLLSRNPVIRRLDVNYSEPDHERIWLTTYPEKQPG